MLTLLGNNSGIPVLHVSVWSHVVGVGLPAVLKRMWTAICSRDSDYQCWGCCMEGNCSKAHIGDDAMAPTHAGPPPWETANMRCRCRDRWDRANTRKVTSQHLCIYTAYIICPAWLPNRVACDARAIDLLAKNHSRGKRLCKLHYTRIWWLIWLMIMCKRVATASGSCRPWGTPCACIYHNLAHDHFRHSIIWGRHFRWRH